MRKGSITGTTGLRVTSRTCLNFAGTRDEVLDVLNCARSLQLASIRLEWLTDVVEEPCRDSVDKFLVHIEHLGSRRRLVAHDVTIPVGLPEDLQPSRVDLGEGRTTKLTAFQENDTDIVVLTV